MRVRVLGSISLEEADGLLHTITAPRLRKLLAILAVHVGDTVPAHRLVDLLWPADPPPSATTAVQVAVSQLRKALEPDRPPRTPSRFVVTRSNGYALILADEQLDATAFEQSVAAACEEGSEPALERALATWCDPPLAEFADEPWAMAYVARLRAARLTAATSRYLAAVRNGRDATILSALTEEVTRQPHEERLVGLLMVVLFRLGRQADALALYSATRTSLRDELGLDPTPELRALERAVLEQDPRLLHRDLHGRRTPARPPHQSKLIGRAGDLQQLQELIDDQRLITLTGPPGTGKTRLATELAKLTSRRRVHLIDLSNVTDPASVAPVIAGQIGLMSEPMESALGALRSAFSLEPTLLILDNCERVVTEAARVVRELVQAANVTILVTSRTPLQLSFEHVSRVGPLDQPSPTADKEAIAASPACRLLADRGGVEIDSNNAESLGRLSRRLDGLPLALELAAFRLRTMSPLDLLRQLEAGVDLVGAGDIEERHRSLHGLVEQCVADLDEAAIRVLGALAVCGGAIPAVVVGTMLDDLDEQAVRTTLAELEARCLVVVRPTGPDRHYRLLETIRSFCLRELQREGALSPFQQRHLGMVLALARTDPTDGVVGLLDVPAEVDVALDRLEAAGNDPDRHFRVLAGAGSFWYRSGRLQEARDRVRRALRMYADGDPVMRGTLAAIAGLISFSDGAFGDLDRYCGEAIDLLTSAGITELDLLAAARSVARRDLDGADRHIGVALSSPGLSGRNRLVALDIAAYTSWFVGDLETAIERLLEQERVATDAADAFFLGRALRGRGLMLAYQGSPESGALLCQRSIELIDDWANDRGATQVLATRSAIAWEFGNVEQARLDAVAAVRRAAVRFDGIPMMLAVPVLVAAELAGGRPSNAALASGWLRGFCRATGMYLPDRAEIQLCDDEQSTQAALTRSDWSAQRAAGAEGRLAGLVRHLDPESSGG